MNKLFKFPEMDSTKALSILLAIAVATIASLMVLSNNSGQYSISSSSDNACIDTGLFRENLMSGENVITVPDNKSVLLDNKSLKEKLEEYEKEIIEKTLLLSNNMKEASEILRIDISTLVRKKQKYKM